MDHGWRRPATKKLWRTATERHKTTMNFITDHIRHLGNEFWWIYIVTDYLMWDRNLVPPMGPTYHAGPTCTHLQMSGTHQPHGPATLCDPWHPSSDPPVAPKDTNKVKWGQKQQQPGIEPGTWLPTSCFLTTRLQHRPWLCVVWQVTWMK